MRCRLDLSLIHICTVLSVVNKPEFLKEVQRKGEYLKNAILAIGSDKIKTVRGMGLIDVYKRQGLLCGALFGALHPDDASVTFFGGNHCMVFLGVQICGTG